MQEPQLFLGLPLDSFLSEELNRLDPEKVKLFITPDPSCLQKVFLQNQAYLGKWIGEIRQVEDFPQLEENIRSLLLKLFPGFSFADYPLMLFPIFATESS